MIAPGQYGDQPVATRRYVLDDERGIPGPHVEDPFNPGWNRQTGGGKVYIDEDVVVSLAGRLGAVSRYDVDVFS